MDATVTRVPEQHRFEIHVDGELAGLADYRDQGDGVLAFTHTEVDPARRGAGIGGLLVGGALDQVRAAGQRVQPLCSFVADFIRRNPPYADLVAYEPADRGGA